MVEGTDRTYLYDKLHVRGVYCLFKYWFKVIFKYGLVMVYLSFIKLVLEYNSAIITIMSLFIPPVLFLYFDFCF